MNLIHDDCLEAMTWLPNGSVDMVLCDLPYGTTNCRWDSPLSLEKLWVQYDRLCRGPIILFAQTPFDKVLGCSNLPLLRYEWIWEKTNPTGHLNATKAPLKSHENILVFYREQPVYQPIKTSGHIRKTAFKKVVNTCPIYGKQTLQKAYDSTERYPRSVLVFPSDKQKSKLHPTQKPVSLCEYLIRTYTNAGDTVLDNCMGSGTTGVACRQSGRKFVGIEKDQQYYEIAKNRINSIEDGSANE